jgi:hypothetical protein
MKNYKVVVYRESLASAFLGAGSVKPQKFTDFLNINSQDGWRVVTMEKDIQRVLLFFRREAYVVVMEKDANESN